jgi:hypothetical protein
MIDVDTPAQLFRHIASQGSSTIEVQCQLGRQLVLIESLAIDSQGITKER